MNFFLSEVIDESHLYERPSIVVLEMALHVNPPILVREELIVVSGFFVEDIFHDSGALVEAHQVSWKNLIENLCRKGCSQRVIEKTIENFHRLRARRRGSTSG